MHVHRLNAQSPRAGKAVRHEIHTAQKTGGELLEIGFHGHGWILVKPTAGLHVNRLVRPEHPFEDIPISVKPQDPVSRVTVELVDEEPGPAHEDIGDTFDALERVVDVLAGCQELMFPHVQFLPPGHVYGNDVTGPIAAERNLSVALGGGHEDLDACHHALESSLHRLDADMH